MTVESVHRRVRVDDLQVVGDIRREIVAYAQEVGAGRDVREAVAVAVSEALTHVLMHAWLDHEPGDVIVEARCEPARNLLVCISDDGRARVPRTDRPHLEIGLHLMGELADEVQISSPSERFGTRVLLRFSLKH